MVKGIFLPPDLFTGGRLLLLVVERFDKVENRF